MRVLGTEDAGGILPGVWRTRSLRGLGEAEQVFRAPCSQGLSREDPERVFLGASGGSGAAPSHSPPEMAPV